MAGVDAVRRYIGAGNPVWFATSPMVAESLHHQGQAFTWLESLLPPHLPDAIGLAAMQAARRLAPVIDGAAEAAGWYDIGPHIVGPMHRAITTLWFKAEVLSRWAAQPAGRRIVVGETSATLQRNGNIGLGRYDTLFAVLAARGQPPGVEVFEHPPEDTTLYHQDIDRLVLADRLFLLADASAGTFLSRIARFLGSGRQIRLGGGGPDVAVLRENETIREMLPRLLRRGCGIRYVMPSPIKAADTPVPGLPDANHIVRELRAAAGGLETRADLQVIAELVAEGLRDASAYWMPTIASASNILAHLMASNSRLVLLSNTVSGAWYGALTSVARRQGVPVIVVEHGVSAGLSRFHLTTRPHSEAQLANSYLVCSAGARDFFEAEPALSGRSVRAIGLTRQTRKIPARWLQRPLARWRIGARPGDRVVMYVTRHVQNNQRFLPHTPEDHEVHSLQRIMADRVMPLLRGIPVIKLYSTRRYRDPDPMAGPFAAPRPVKTFKTGDFRFLRAGADILIVESPLSTLGWAMGTGKPIFYLAHPSLPLLPDAQAAMEEAVFFFDLSKNDWSEHLVARLNRADESIAADWRAKAPARERFLRHYVFGPERPGSNGVEAVFMAACAGGPGCAISGRAMAAE